MIVQAVSKLTSAPTMPVGSVYSILSKKENAHEDAIYCGVWTKITETGNPKDPGKEYLVTGGLDSLVKVWTLDINKLELLHTLKGHCMSVMSIAVSPDGHTIASASLDSTIIIWELTTGYTVHKIETKATDVWKLVFSPDGTQVATAGFTGQVVIYGVEKGTISRTLDTRGKFGMSVAWSPNDTHLAVGSVEGLVYIFDVAQGKLVHTITAHKDSVRCLTFSHNSKLLATGSSDGKLKVYDVISATLHNTLDHKSWVLAACFSSDHTRVATAAADGCVRVAHIVELNVLHAFHEHTDSACGLQFNSNSKKLMSVSKDKSINIYECPIPPKLDKK